MVEVAARTIRPKIFNKIGNGLFVYAAGLTALDLSGFSIDYGWMTAVLFVAFIAKKEAFTRMTGEE